MRFLPERIRAIRPLYLQFLFVVLAFIGMVASSDLYLNKVLHSHLDRDARHLLAETILKIETELVEPEVVLTTVTETVRGMIARGDGAEAVLDYMRIINAKLHSQAKEFKFDALYGYFPVFGGSYLHALGWKPPKDYDPMKRPWYETALKAGDATATTPIYMNVRLQKYIIAYVRNILDHDGKVLGIVCLNVPLDNITRHIASMRLTPNGYGIFHNEKLEVFHHPDPGMVGKNLREAGGDIARFAGDAQKENGYSAREGKNYRGEAAIFFSLRSRNGWTLHTIVPKREHHRELYEMGIMLGILGALLAAALCAMLLRLDRAKRATDEESRSKSALLAILKKEREEDERTQIMLDAMPLSCMLWDENLQLLACNEATLHLFKVADRQEIVFAMLSPERQPGGGLSADMVRDCLRQAFEGSCFRFEWLHRTMDGELFPAEITLVRVMHREEHVVAAYIRDLRDLKAMLRAMSEAEDDLRAARDAAETASRSKSAFLANMSHEIRTPMNAILGIAEIRLQDETLAPDMREALGRIYSASDLLLGIINDILDMSKIEAGKLELMPAIYDVASLINDAVQLNTMRIGSKPVEFTLHVDADTPATALGDALRVKQILNNILSNAFKYTARGEVSLSVSPGAESASEDRDSGVTLVFQVSDTGPGMTAEQIAKMFDKYSRFNQEANRVTEGTGLGMNITRDLVRMMNGRIDVESEPGKGSTFTVSLPQGKSGSRVLGRDAAESLRRFRMSGKTNMKRAQILREPMPYGRVLIVDDVETNIYVARGLLAPYGLTVDSAESGFAAIAKIEQGNTYDIVFMDHMMPEMDGMETTKILRGHGYVQPVVALTANAVTGQAEMFRENGFDEFISKPIDIRQMNAVLNKFVRDRHPPDVVAAARREQGGRSIHGDAPAVTEPGPDVDPKLAKIFVRDASRGATVLDALCARESLADEDVRTHVITVHGLKSVLANVGEADLSALAGRLEQAGREGDRAVLASETPEFLRALRQVIARIMPPSSPSDEDGADGETSDADRAHLREVLRALRTACAAYDKKAAKSALAGLEGRPWPRPIRERLDAVAEQLLHSDFKEIARVADEMINE